MSETKLRIRIYTVADFYEEENWLREEHQKGWKLTKMTPPCFYLFEKCEPEDVIYRLDYKNSTGTDDYMQMMQDYEWEYFAQCIGWLYFRKPASRITTENEGELFSDNASRIDMLQHVIRTRMLPLLIIFLCCVIPNTLKSFDNEFGTIFTIFWVIMFVIYALIFIHCGRKLWILKKDLE